MKKPPEIVPGDKQVRLNFYLFLAFYVLILISLEPFIDFVLLLGTDAQDPQSIILMNQNKIIITKIVMTAVQILPLFIFCWLGFRILTSAKLPPARMKLPFAVPLVKGRNARLIGLVVILSSLFFISYDLMLMTQQ